MFACVCACVCALHACMCMSVFLSDCLSVCLVQHHKHKTTRVNGTQLVVLQYVSLSA